MDHPIFLLCGLKFGCQVSGEHSIQLSLWKDNSKAVVKSHTILNYFVLLKSLSWYSGFCLAPMCGVPKQTETRWGGYILPKVGSDPAWIRPNVFSSFVNHGTAISVTSICKEKYLGRFWPVNIMGVRRPKIQGGSTPVRKHCRCGHTAYILVEHHRSNICR